MDHAAVWRLLAHVDGLRIAEVSTFGISIFTFGRHKACVLIFDECYQDAAESSFGATHAHATRMQPQSAAIIATLVFLPALLCAQSSQADVNAKYVKQWSERIAGKENEPAEKVFKNLQYLRNTRAALLLTIMDVGYSRGLGVTCTHCHVETDFASDDKRPKRAAREMAAMHRMINQQLAKMENLNSNAQNRAINCSTCHRGEAIPQR